MNNMLLSPEFWFIIGIPITFLLGSLAHFAYDWSGKSVIVGIFTPVNESIWEHLKLSTYPTFIWYILGILIFRDKVNLYIWVICSVISVITSCIIITCFFYTYTGALGIQSLFLDIFSLFLGLSIAQCLSLHIYKYATLTMLHFYLSIIIGSLIIICFTLFTFFPPKLPIFMDPITKKYGIH
ncbi:DUF6512 family protein [Clostridium beijerinckii]|uniref:Uncharacterized protein n=1 Tax=Clostridium beijerinckii TaxID=1520 RepID=A0AAE5H5E2_CLOBE|nr:DUF6512 family protein [Clostridium beijerinckii]NSB14505.1 hypothetical protein [Clostridium beijerinckii]OOM24159.1 hypothetical protein CLOBE_39120 [Clostridium beijerinckii]